MTNARILNFATNNRILKLRQTLEATYTRIKSFEILIDFNILLTISKTEAFFKNEVFYF